MFIGNINTIPSIVNLPGQNNREFESLFQFVFDGGDGFLRSPTFNNYRITDNLAISCWVTFGSQLFGTGPQNYMIVDQATANFNFGYSLYITKTSGGTTFLRFRVGIGDSTNTTSQIRIDNISDIQTKKFLILASYNEGNGETELSLRGVGVSLDDNNTTAPSSSPIAYSPATNTFCIGNTSPVGNLEFDGGVDEVGIFNNALNQANANELFDWGANGDLQTYATNKNLEAWYRMGENASFAQVDPTKTGVWTLKNAVALSDATKNLTSSLTSDTDTGNLPESARQSPGIPPPE